MLGPTTWAVENRGSSTVNVCASRIAPSDEVVPRDQPAVAGWAATTPARPAQAGQRGMGILVEL